jgi:hypothetical protein
VPEGRAISLKSKETIMATVKGDNNFNILDGTDEADTVQGFGGDDLITTFSGFDVISGGPGSNIINPGNGEDTVEIRPDHGTDTVKGFNYDGDLLVFNGFANINKFDDLADFIRRDDPYLIIDVSAAEGGEPGDYIVRLTPARTLTSLDVAFDTPVFPIAFDPNPAEVLMADPNLRPPPIGFFD